MGQWLSYNPKNYSALKLFFMVLIQSYYLLYDKIGQSTFHLVQLIID